MAHVRGRGVAALTEEPLPGLGADDPEHHQRLREHSGLAAKLAVRRAATVALGVTPRSVLHVCCGAGDIAAAMAPEWPIGSAHGIDRDAAMCRRWDTGHTRPAVCADATRWMPLRGYDIVDIDPYGGAAHIVAHLMGSLPEEPVLWCVTDGAGHTRLRQRRPWLWHEMRMGPIDSDAAHEQQRDLPSQMAAWMSSMGRPVGVVEAQSVGRMWYMVFG